MSRHYLGLDVNLADNAVVKRLYVAHRVCG